MAEDPLVRWSQPNHFGIEVDSSGRVFNTGRLTGVVELVNSAIVVGSDSGGVWVLTVRHELDGSVTPLGALPVSDYWESPDITCLHLGTRGPEHLYAGTSQGTIWETDVQSAFPLLNWVPNPDWRFRIDDIVVFPTLNRIVIAGNGIWWADIPPNAGDPLDWHGTRSDGPGISSAYKLAAGSTTRDTGIPDTEQTATVIAGGTEGGIFWGRWEGGELVFRRSKLRDRNGNVIDDLQDRMGPVSVASWQSWRAVAYAGCSELPGGPLMMVAKSQDGGQTWVERGLQLDNISGKTMVDVAGYGAKSHRNCIDVSPWNSELIALGWQHEAPFISRNGGRSWYVPSSPHLHADIDCVYFQHIPPDVDYPNQRNHLFVAGDGGLAMTHDIDLDHGPVFTSDFNRYLATQQFAGPLSDSNENRSMFEATLTASATPVFGTVLVAGGLQDNGVVYSFMGAAPQPWRKLRGGDGEVALIVAGQLVHSVMSERIQSSRWRFGTTQFDAPVVIPISIPPPSEPELAWSQLGDVSCSAVVTRPAYRTEHGFLLVGLAGKGQHVYGLFMNSDGEQGNWQWLTSIPHPNVSAVGSYDGQGVLVGGVGVLYALDTTTRHLDAVPIVLPATSSGHPIPPGTIFQIVPQDAGSSWAGLLDTSRARGYVAQVSGGQAQSRSTGLPTNRVLYALALDPTTDPVTLYAASDARVFVSRDEGMSWDSASAGLPRLPHCSALEFTAEPRGKYLYLATWGRSVWVARLDGDPGADPYPPTPGPR